MCRQLFQTSICLSFPSIDYLKWRKMRPVNLTESLVQNWAKKIEKIFLYLFFFNYSLNANELESLNFAKCIIFSIITIYSNSKLERCRFVALQTLLLLSFD